MQVRLTVAHWNQKTSRKWIEPSPRNHWPPNHGSWVPNQNWADPHPYPGIRTRVRDGSSWRARSPAPKLDGHWSMLVSSFINVIPNLVGDFNKAPIFGACWLITTRFIDNTHRSYILFNVHAASDNRDRADF